MRTAAMVIGLIMGVFLFIGGALGACTGALFEVGEEVIGQDLDDGSEGSTTEEIASGGALAVFVAFILLIGAGLAKVALKTSTILMAISFLGCVSVVTIDSWSAFAFVYWPALIVAAICSALMIMAWRKEGRGEYA